jgi:hypothetical protein
LGYAKLSIGLDRASPDHPQLELGPFQREPNQGHVNRLAQIGWQHLSRESIVHAITISVDENVVDMASLTTDVAGKFKDVVFTKGVKDTTMYLQAGQHRMLGTRMIFSPSIKFRDNLVGASSSRSLLLQEKTDLSSVEYKLLKEATWLIAFYRRMFFFRLSFNAIASHHCL